MVFTHSHSNNREEERFRKINESPLATANKILQEKRQQSYSCEEKQCDKVFPNHAEMHFHWLIKHKVEKNKKSNCEQPEEIEVDDFIRQIGAKEIEIDFETVEPEDQHKGESNPPSESDTNESTDKAKPIMTQ